MPSRKALPEELIKAMHDCWILRGKGKYYVPPKAAAGKTSASETNLADVEGETCDYYGKAHGERPCWKRIKDEKKARKKAENKIVAGPKIIQGAEKADAAEEAKVVEKEIVEVMEMEAGVMVAKENISKATVMDAEFGATRKLIAGTNLKTHICVPLITGPCRIKKLQGLTLKSYFCL